MQKKPPQCLPHDGYILFNDEDARLSKDSLIRYELPEPPIYEHIHNYGVPAEQCFWKPFEPPHKLKALQLRNDLTDNQKIQFIEENQDYYKSEILWIQEDQRRSDDGFWMFIGTRHNGILQPKPYWIPPDHYFFLQNWDVGGGLPDFRMRDRKFYIFWYMVLFDKSCTGFNYPKHRREGATTKVQEIRYKLVSKTFDVQSGIQSKTKKDAEEVHETHLMKPWRRLPFWHRPIWDADERKKDEIAFSAPTSKAHPDYGKKALDSKLDYRESGVFAYDGTKQILIHSDEIGKTTECDVVNRLQVQLPCVYRGGRIIGKIINTSTVAELNKQGGAAFRRICDASHFLKKDQNNRTLYGLYNLFIPAFDGFELELADVNRICEQIGRPPANTAYPDKYGFCDREICETFLKNRRKAYIDNGDLDGYIEECRLFPITWDDCWMQSASNNNFNIVVLNDRLNELRTEENRQKVVRGNFQWDNGIKDSKVIFIPDERGRFIVSYLFPNPDTQANRFYIDENGIRFPDNKYFTAGADPFKFRRTSQGKRSDGAGTIFWDFDSTVDDRTKPVSTWKSNRFVCTYSNRPDDKYAYAEDMLMMCVYYGADMNSERNIDLVNEHFEQRGYEGFLLNKLTKSNKMEKIPGEYASVAIVEEIFREYQHYIQRFGFRELHPEILEQCIEISDDMQDYDLFAAGGYALLGAKRKRAITERFYTVNQNESIDDFIDESVGGDGEDGDWIGDF